MTQEENRFQRSNPSRKRILGLMAKYWDAGRVKTRLAQSMIDGESIRSLDRSGEPNSIPAAVHHGEEALQRAQKIAAELHRRFVGELVTQLGSCGELRQLVVSPATAVAEFSEICNGVWHVLDQGDGDLGSRMQRWFVDCLTENSDPLKSKREVSDFEPVNRCESAAFPPSGRGPQGEERGGVPSTVRSFSDHTSDSTTSSDSSEHRMGESAQAESSLIGDADCVSEEVEKHVVLIGADCPLLLPRDIDEAWDQLHDHDIVLGPAEDGGYYLIGLSSGKSAAEIQTVFQGIAWSTGDVLDQTLVAVEGLGWRVALLEQRSDVDTNDDLEGLLSKLEVQDRDGMHAAFRTDLLQILAAE
ncbi:hypothetical protein SAMN06265222_12378 [Neorhodopirellula lusitana]|uniref:Glycosyltransferase n=1 Tax=Neorhodopirellula lusitana TaxID=445327 RepID=A0ABY1QSG5_9BACT|nr:TIGR04282 family arsenosugar biosynthesis glycosyltransferase [Neorhodopirellula lusitana]SMP77692.1 hypothetical protein SAMN06265222_12378 [Neorhodopirellula lusitana]